MLRVEFTSRTDLYEASDGGGSGLYVLASFCPYRDERTLYIGEPYYNDRDRYGPTRVVEMSEIEERRPAKDASGMYVYTTYLALSRPGAPEQSGIPEQFAYDLRRQPLDLCLRIYHPGYFITPSQSQVFTIRAAMIQRAIKPARAARRGSSSASGQDDPPSVI